MYNVNSVYINMTLENTVFNRAMLTKADRSFPQFCVRKSSGNYQLRIDLTTGFAILGLIDIHLDYNDWLSGRVSFITASR